MNTGTGSTLSLFGLFTPLKRLFDSPFLSSYPIVWVLTFALLPFVILSAIFTFGLYFEQSVWIIGAYFCCFWAFYLNQLMVPDRGMLKTGIGYMLFTATCGIPLLFAWQQFPIISSLYISTESTSHIKRLLGYFLGVGIFEELCKALPLFFFAMRNDKLDTKGFMFLGVMSGLGFALAEVVQYSINYAKETAELSAYLLAQAAGESRGIFGHLNTDKFVSKVQSTIPQMMENYGTILTIQIVRFIPLPLLHAVWTGIVAWFVAVAMRNTRNRWLIISTGIVGVALLHGLYDVFSGSILAMLLAGLSILVFLSYLSHDSDVLAITSPTETRIIQCEQCGQKLRIPCSQVELQLTCPRCKNHFNAS